MQLLHLEKKKTNKLVEDLVASANVRVNFDMTQLLHRGVLRP